MIAFYDVETTIPIRKGQTFAMIEFGAVVLDQKGLYERECYSTLIKPRREGNLAPISERSINCNGITERMVKDSPSFADVADSIFRVLDGRIWAGHNIRRFDNPRIEQEFKAIGREPPKPSGIIDTLPLLKRSFGAGRAGNLKMATLGHYFGLGAERHRALEDARMNIEVLKSCATVILLEENFASMLSLGKPVDEEMPAGAIKAVAAGGDKKAAGSKKTTQEKGGKSESSDIAAAAAAADDGKAADKPKASSSTTPKADDGDSEAIATKLPEISEEEKRKVLSTAMENKATVWIRYNGGSNPLQPRPIIPLEWKNHLVKATCKQSGSERHFRLDRIVEIISKVWSE